MKDELISRIERMEKCLKTYPSYKAITSKLDRLCFNYTITVERVNCILGKEEDNFEKWIKTRIQELSKEYDEDYAEHLTIEEDTLIEGKIEAFIECLRKHRQLKNKGEI